MKPQLTLLICTFNGSRTIQQALESIANQSDVSKEKFEILVVDNASTDDTFRLATESIQQLDLSGRVIKEPKVGKINAFLTGVEAAEGELISIIDDDNFIEPGFIHYTLEIFDRYPQVGMTGSRNHILDDQGLPFWFAWANGRYACAQPWMTDVVQDKSESSIVIAETAVISGAGSTFRVKPVLDCLNKGYCFFNDTHRGKKMKITGEDLELCWLMRSLGWHFAYDSRVQIRHAIKKERLELNQFQVLCKTIGAGSIGIDPFLFTHKHSGERWPFKWTWQWQLISKIRRYVNLQIVHIAHYSADEKQKFKDWRDRIECTGAIQRLISERGNYTQHIRQVASGDWTELRVK
ncbi:MAG: glycosyltransferase family A protein [Cyanobacteria bacterium J06634_6]